MLETFTVFMTDTEGDAEHVASSLRPADVLCAMPEETATRYSVTKYRGDEAVETLNGVEWLDKYTYLTRPVRRAY
jgi:hypothetical protein